MSGERASSDHLSLRETVSSADALGSVFTIILKLCVQIGANFEPADQNDANNKSQGEDQTDRTFDFFGPV